MMLQQYGLSFTMLLLSAGLTAIGLQQGYGWLDRLVQFHKNKLVNEVRELAPIELKGKFTVELQPKPRGYEDSRQWDEDSVLRLLTLIRESEKAKPVHKALRRMLRPTRRIMMSMKESMKKFPSIKNDDNNFYYDVDYSEENAPPSAPLPEDHAVIVVSNPVEARLPSARISVKLLREILEARARAARQMPTTTTIIPWIEFVKNRTLTSTEAGTKAATHTTSTTGKHSSTDAADDQKSVADSLSTEMTSSGPKNDDTEPEPAEPEVEGDSVTEAEAEEEISEAESEAVTEEKVTVAEGG